MKRKFCSSLAAFLVVALLGAGTVIADPLSNTAFGTGALPNSGGDFNSAFERDALTTNDTGESNIAIGFDALRANTSGTSETWATPAVTC
jgi:hypothetical protein